MKQGEHATFCDKHVLKIGSTITLIAALLLAIFYWIVADNWSFSQYSDAALIPTDILPPLSDGDVVEQSFSTDGAFLDSITLYSAVYQPLADCSLRLELLAQGQVLADQTLTLSEIANLNYTTITFPAPAVPLDNILTLRITCRSDTPQALALYYGSTISVGKSEIAAPGLDKLTLNQEGYSGRLSSTITSHAIHSIAKIYWLISAAVILLFLGVSFLLAWKQAHHKKSLILMCCALTKQYSFLIHQLVSRDFNTKYRRSALGVIWSFLNPLLTMLVQYLVFSTLFQSNIENFPVYLMTGIVTFNFFSESVGLGLDSIVTSASLITKVYMPKLIFPISRVLSSLINLLISFIPLLLLILITGMHISKSILLLPIVIVLLTLFCFGMSFILATANVFFRDTRFLWGVLIMIWTYLTPIFYPESIIPVKLLPLYHMNPMYQFIYFLRTITIGNVAPAPINLLYCALAALIPLAIGLWIFRKNQQKFVLYL